MRDEPRSPTPQARHQLEHEIPTVIHNPEEDMPLLARWLSRAMANPARFWGLVAGLVLAVTALIVVSNGLSLGRSASDAAWARLETAKTAPRRVEIAREFPGTQAEQWALLQAATEYYGQGFNDLPANRDAALPTLRKALDLFDEVAREAPQDSPQARAAAFGAARTLEARNELDKAIKQYEKVASTWKGTPEAADAERLAEALRKPENVAFYKDLYAFKPAEVALPPGSGMGAGAGAGSPDGLTLPAGGSGSMTLPSDHPPIGGLPPTSAPSLFSPLIPPPPASSSSGTATGNTPPPATGEAPRAEPPSSLPPPPPSPEPKVEPAPAPKAETAPEPKPEPTPAEPPKAETAPAPKAEPTPAEPPKEKKDQVPAEAPKGELPEDPFAPKS